MEKAAPAGTASFGWLPLIKGWIKGVEVLGIQLVGENAQAFAEAGKLSKCRQTQVFPGVGVFGRCASNPLRHPQVTARKDDNRLWKTRGGCFGFSPGGPDAYFPDRRLSFQYWRAKEANTQP